MKEYDLYKVVDKISVRTGMYVGDETLDNVATYLVGYSAAMYDAGIKEVSSPRFIDFRDWLQARFGFFETTPGWVNMIIALSLGHDPRRDKTPSWDKMKKQTDEQHRKSVKLFFELLHEYRNDKSFAPRTRGGSSGL